MTDLSLLYACKRVTKVHVAKTGFAWFQIEAELRLEISGVSKHRGKTTMADRSKVKQHQRE